MAEFLAPLRLVLRGLGLAVGALALVLCALFIQVTAREFIASSPAQAPPIQVVYIQPTKPQLAQWSEADRHNQRLLGQVILNRRRSGLAP